MSSAFVTVAVSDTQGGAIPNARVHILERSSKNETEKLTGETGDVTLRLQPGKFDLTVKGPTGFQDTVMIDVDARPGEHRHINVVLKVKTSCCIDPVPNERIEPESVKFGELKDSTEAKTAIREPAPLTGLVNISEDNKPTLSEDALTAEQFAVYRTFLSFYARVNGDALLHLADTTDWLDLSDVKQDADCSKSFGPLEFDEPRQSGPTVHRLDPNLAIEGHIALVDAERQSQKVRENDPSKTMREGKPVDRAVSDAVASGLLTLSEIAFDKKHTRAVMGFSFFCGRLCGNSGVVMLKRAGRHWKLTKRSCEESVS
jgi:hypothetical protein